MTTEGVQICDANVSSSESVSPLSDIREANLNCFAVEQIETKERGCIPLDQIQEFTEIAIPSAGVSENDLSIDIERKQKETKRKRQILAFVIVCVLIVAGVIIEKIKF
jgi:hypothetical protein